MDLLHLTSLKTRFLAICFYVGSSYSYTLCLRRSKNKTHGYIHCAKKSNSDKYLMGIIPKQEKDPKALSQI